jgi:hypothetical protein
MAGANASMAHESHLAMQAIMRAAHARIVQTRKRNNDRPPARGADAATGRAQVKPTEKQNGRRASPRRRAAAHGPERPRPQPAATKSRRQPDPSRAAPEHHRASRPPLFCFLVSLFAGLHFRARRLGPNGGLLFAAPQEMGKFNWTSLAIPSGEASVVRPRCGARAVRCDAMRCDAI